MSRQLKPQKLGEIAIPNSGGERLELMLDRNKLVFFFEIDGERVEDKVYDELNTKARKFVKDYVRLDWMPVIEINLQDPHQWDATHGNHRHLHPQDAEIDIKIDRFLLAHGRQAWREVEWHIAPEDRSGCASTFWMPRHVTGTDLTTILPIKIQEGTYLLAYDEEIWQGLLRMIEAIHLTYDRIHALISTPEGQKKLTQVGAITLLSLPKGPTP